LIVPSEVKESVTEVTLEVSREGDIVIGTEAPWRLALVLVGSLHHGQSGDGLGPNHTREVVKGGESRGDVLGTRESDSSFRGQISNNSKHRDTSMLQLNPTKTFKVFSVTVLNKAQRIPESEWDLGSDLVSEGSLSSSSGKSSGGNFLFRRSKGGGASDKGCDDTGLHG